MVDEAAKLIGSIEQIINGDEIARKRHPWSNDPLPKPIAPKPSQFKLTVSKPDDTTCEATATEKEPLLELSQQFEKLDYRFMKLERISV